MMAVFSLESLLIFGVLTASTTIPAAVIISEVADKGSSNVCSGEDWLELHNTDSSEAVNLTGYILHDDNGVEDEDAFAFAPETPLLAAQEYRFICTNRDGGPQFGIGNDDTVTLVDTNGQVVSSVVLLGMVSEFDVTYAWNETGGSYVYTTTPTPGEPNVLTPLETLEQRKERLVRQNEEGTRFFGMDDRGYAVNDAFEQVLDFYITMEEQDYDYLIQNQSYEVYKPFQTARIVQDGQELLFLSSPGRIRSKGQSTLYMGTCLSSPTIPFQLDMDHTNKTQTLFGVERLYLRNHMGDNSYMRDWSSHRMLARFGLPHLRARKVRFYINNEKKGLYTLLEAPDQDYVFSRSFPDYIDPYALFKIKSLSIGCGSYRYDQLRKAQSRINETDTPPYAYERGEHRNRTPVLGLFAIDECVAGFYDNILNVETADVVLAFIRSNADCGSFLVEEGLIDRDLGSKDLEPSMEAFINDNLANNACDSGCANSDLASQVDLDNFLKNFAVYAVTMNQDSPMGNLNNYYLASDGTGWKIVQYDHNNAGDQTCNPDECNEKLVHWSIVRPTCASLESNQLVGPLLSDPDLHAQYIEYVRSFVDTVIGNESFVEEMMQHAQTIQDDVAEDFWSFGGIFYDNELSPDASEWNIPQLPLLPLLKAREADVRAQLAAYDAGTFPRGPHLSQGVEPFETCVDWRTTEPPQSVCGEHHCAYEGCDMPDWTVPYICNEDDGICYHGDFDEQCYGIDLLGRYPGMEDRPDGRTTFCVDAGGEPIKVSECPPFISTSTPPTSLPTSTLPTSPPTDTNTPPTSPPTDTSSTTAASGTGSNAVMVMVLPLLSFLMFAKDV